MSVQAAKTSKARKAASKPASAAQAAPAATVQGAPAAPAVAAPQAAVVPVPLVLVAVAAPGTPRPGTARAAALAALLANIGQPRQAVLQAVAASETQWHLSQGRSPKGISPAGWLRLFGAQFAPTQAAQ